MREECRVCAYYVPDVLVGQGFGRCHRYPPQIDPTSRAGGGIRGSSEFPILIESERCGEFMRRGAS
jgi:hypothetical protein